VTDEQIELVKRTICKEASDDELQLFLNVCKRTQLDPFARQIYATWRYDKQKQQKVMTITVSIDGFRLIAERTGKYSGQDGPYWCGDDGVWHDIWLKKSPPAAAKVGIFRDGFKQPLFAVATWEAYSQDNYMWKKMGAHMLAKCAEMLGLRRTFPQELSNIYGDDEMGSPGEPEERPLLVSAAVRFAEETGTQLTIVDQKPPPIEMPEDTEPDDVDFNDRVDVNQWDEKYQSWQTVRSAPRATPKQIQKIGILRAELGHHLDRIITDPVTKKKSTQKEGKLRQNYFATFGKESTTELTSGEASRTIHWLENMKCKVFATMNRDVPEAQEFMRARREELGSQEKTNDPLVQCEKGNCGICKACKDADAYLMEQSK